MTSSGRRHRKRRRYPTEWSAFAASLVVAAAVPMLVTDAPPQFASAASAASTPTTSPAAAPTTLAPFTAPASSPEPSPTSTASPPRTGLAQGAVDAAESAAGSSTELAVAVLDRSTGELAVGGRGDEPFYTASLSKLVVTVDVLDRRRLEGLQVGDADLALFRRALGPSDDSAMSALWERFDGEGAPARVSKRLGLEHTSAPHRFGQWGEVEVSAVDYVKIWRHVFDEMPEADRDLLLGDMQAAPATANDGFDQAFGLLSPAVRGDGSGAVAKQGWMCCFSGRYYLHSAGAVGTDRRFLVTLLTRDPRTNGWDGARAQLDGIANAAVATLR
jgi:hypothetical protein